MPVRQRRVNQQDHAALLAENQARLQAMYQRAMDGSPANSDGEIADIRPPRLRERRGAIVPDDVAQIVTLLGHTIQDAGMRNDIFVDRPEWNEKTQLKYGEIVGFFKEYLDDQQVFKLQASPFTDKYVHP